VFHFFQTPVLDTCENLNNILRHGIWYDAFQVQNTKLLWLVNDIVETINSDKVLCDCFGLYPSYVGGTLNTVRDIDYYVVCSEKLNNANYIEKCMANKKCTISVTGEFSGYVIKEK
jgi:hypothetical protein